MFLHVTACVDALCQKSLQVKVLQTHCTSLDEGMDYAFIHALITLSTLMLVRE